jgi:hypothetical protein
VALADVGELELVAAGLRWRLSEYVGGEAGAALRARASAWMERHGVRNPARMANLFFPPPDWELAARARRGVPTADVDDEDARPVLRAARRWTAGLSALARDPDHRWRRRIRDELHLLRERLRER